MDRLPPDLQRMERWVDRLMIACLCMFSFAAGYWTGLLAMFVKLMER